MTIDEKQFDVALSFAGEDRSYVEELAVNLFKMGIKVFYDKYEDVTLWGKNLYDHLQDIYQNKARYTVMFISEHYSNKVWTNHERKSAQARAFESNIEYILPVRFDQTKIPGLLPTIGYVNAAEYSPMELAILIKDKIGPIRRYEFFPEDPDLLFKKLKCRGKKSKYKVKRVAEYIFEQLKLMTPEERNVVYETTINSCPAGFPENFHLKIEVLSRILRKSVEEIQYIYSRLDSLGIISRIRKQEKDEDHICKESTIIEIGFDNLLVEISDIENATFVVIGIMDILQEHLCPECRKRAFIDLDFSILSTLTGYPEDKLTN